MIQYEWVSRDALILGNLNLYWFGPPIVKFLLLILLVMAIWLASSDSVKQGFRPVLLLTSMWQRKLYPFPMRVYFDHDASKQCDAIWEFLFQHSLQQEQGSKQALSCKHVHHINLRQWIGKFQGYSFVWFYLVRWGIHSTHTYSIVQ